MSGKCQYSTSCQNAAVVGQLYCEGHSGIAKESPNVSQSPYGDLRADEFSYPARRRIPFGRLAVVALGFVVLLWQIFKWLTN
jgi:hypothetical protein